MIITIIIAYYYSNFNVPSTSEEPTITSTEIPSIEPAIEPTLNPDTTTTTTPTEVPSPSETSLEVPSVEPTTTPTIIPTAPTDGLPTTVDWTLEVPYDGYSGSISGPFLNPVQDQGNCGSCWAFAATAVLETALYLKQGGNLQKLSEQFVVSCDTDGGNSGCNGDFC